eukprot:3124572-Prymnesium_polylepis.1
MPRLGGPARSLLVGTSIFALLRGLTALPPLLGGGNAVLVYATTALFIVTGFTYSLIEVGSLAWVLTGVPAAQRTEANGKLMMTRSVGTLVGPLAGGATYNAFGSGDLGY